MSVTLLCGEVRTVLRSRPAESVHVVVTSVPYWGLRAYSTDPQVWGGRAGCSHDWTTERTARPNAGGGTGAASQKQTTNQGAFCVEDQDRATYSDTCALCGAWRGELGLEPTVGLYIEHLVEVFREVRRVLRRDGTCWLNIGDCYAGTPNGWDAGKYRERGGDDRTFRDKPFATTGGGLKPKDLALVPQRLAIALQEDGWWVRSDVIWHKPNPLPESIQDRPTKSHEYLWMLARSEEYFFDGEAVREPAAGTTAHDLTGCGYDAPGQTPQRGNRGPIPAGWDTQPGAHDTVHRASNKQVVGPTKKYEVDGRNSTDGRAKPHAAGPAGSVDAMGAQAPSTRHIRTVWRITTQPFPGAHFATFPERLVEPCILAGTSAHGVCGLCGAPWERIVEKGAADLEHQLASGADSGGEYHGAATKEYEGAGAQDPSAVKARILEGMRERRTTGWRPACDCHPAFAGDPVPATVLDPFVGSGTTCVVAERLGRDSLGIDLSAEYLELARERIEKAQPKPPEPTWEEYWTLDLLRDRGQLNGQAERWEVVRDWADRQQTKRRKGAKR